MASRFRWTLTNLGDSTSEVLTRDPLGWEDVSIKIIRDKIYHGVFTDFTTSGLKFHCDGGGKSFIDNVKNTEDVNGVVEILIEMDCDGSGSYSELYVGKIDLLSYKTDNETTTVLIERSDLYSKIRARDEISVSLETEVSIGQTNILPIDTNQLEINGMHIILENEYNSTASSSEIIDFAMFGDGSSATSVEYYVRPQITLGSTTLGGIEEPVSLNEYLVVTPVSGSVAETGELNPIYEYNEDRLITPSPLTIAYDLLLNVYYLSKQGAIGCDDSYEHCHNLKIILAYGDDWDTRTEITIYDYDTSPGDNDVYTVCNNSALSLSCRKEYIKDPIFGGGATPITANGTLTLLDGQSIWFYCYYQGEAYAAGTSPCVGVFPFSTDREIDWDFRESYINLYVDTEYEDTTSKTVLIHEAFNQVADAIADVNFSFYSDFYGRTDSQKTSYNSDGCGSLISITNGLCLREFDSNIYCTLKDLFNCANSIHNVGLGIERFDGLYAPMQDVIRVEPLEYFYDKTTEVLSLTRPVKVEISKMPERYYNSVNIGYNKWEPEVRGGLDEPNTKHEYSTKVNGGKGVYSKLCDYISSSYSIELTRRKNRYRFTSFEDWKYDNDNFLISIVRTVRADFIDSGGGSSDLIILYDVRSFPYSAGETFTISGSASNDGIYTFLSAVISVNDYVITVLESVIAENNQVITIDGFLRPEKYTDSFGSGSNMVAIDSAFNLRLTPARMLLAHIGVLTGALQIINGTIAFVKGEGNFLLSVEKTDVGCQEDYSGEALSENQSFNWNDTNAANITPLWLPEVFKFEYPLTAANLSAIRANPHGYVEVTDDHGNINRGFILDVEFKLKTGLTKFELLKIHQ